MDLMLCFLMEFGTLVATKGEIVQNHRLCTLNYELYFFTMAMQLVNSAAFLFLIRACSELDQGTCAGSSWEIQERDSTGLSHHQPTLVAQWWMQTWLLIPQFTKGKTHGGTGFQGIATPGKASRGPLPKPSHCLLLSEERDGSKPVPKHWISITECCSNQSYRTYLYKSFICQLVVDPDGFKPTNSTYLSIYNKHIRSKHPAVTLIVT